jgi:hypothetical protein
MIREIEPTKIEEIQRLIIEYGNECDDKGRKELIRMLQIEVKHL